MTDLQFLSELSNKEKIQSMTKSVKSMVLEGEVNALDVAITLKGMEDFTKALRGDALIQDATLEELEKHGGKTVVFKGAKFSIKDMGVSYDYSECGDPTWDDLNEKMNVLKEKIKAREEFLKSIQGSVTIVDADTGEVSTVYPPVRRSKTGYAVTL